MGETKAVRDRDHDQVKAQRRCCTTCGRTFRVYPTGVSQAQQSNRLKAMSALLYILGVSYGDVAAFLTAIGLGIGKTAVYDNVQAAGVQARKRQESAVKYGGQRTIIGADGTDDETGDLLGLDITTNESAEEIEPFIRDSATQVEAEVLVSDDFDTYKNIADNADLAHQICQSHIIRNVDTAVESIGQPSRMIYPPLIPKGIKSSYHQIERDGRILQGLVRVARPMPSNLWLSCMTATTPRQLRNRSKDTRFGIA